ncbi:MAG: hypothetical protein A2583_01200 [Bdellovibrionales bacterium RIFOXYD1_FULL_53_11]|nr:MAG: hypothetical protein A2583_01200 [Bdellovibrionales bacterium RIFOXYD1_FULL_53_11]
MIVAALRVMCSGMSRFFLAFLVFAACTTSHASGWLEGVFGNISDRHFEGTYAQLEQLAGQSARDRVSVVRLLGDIAKFMFGRDSSVTFSGDDLRRLDSVYLMGEGVMYALVPPDRVERIIIGRMTSDKPEIDLRLDRDTTTSFRYLKLFTITLQLERFYGVSEISGDMYKGIHGLRATWPGGTSDLQYVKLSGRDEITVKIEGGPAVTMKTGPIKRRE